MATQPNIMKIAWAKNGAKTSIPETTTTLGAASLSQGFPTETSLPIDDGGVPPRREDFNGAFNMLSMFAMFQQSGGQFSWSAQVDYDMPSIIYHNGDLWWCLRSNGVSSTPIEPGTDDTAWIKFKSYISSPLDAYPVGAYYISSDSTSPATLFGGTWTQIQNRMIMAAGSSYSVGATGGSATKKLTTDNLPAHTHSCGSAGSHSHTKGSMDITGAFPVSREAQDSANNHYSGAFSKGSTATGSWGNDADKIGSMMVNFKASNSWTGSTSSTVNHTHTIGTTGKTKAFDIMPPYIVAYVWRRTA